MWRICFIPDNDTLIFGVPNSYFFNRILFFFQVLWRTLWKGGNCFHLRLWWQPLQVFIVHKDWEIFKTFLAKIKIRNKCEMLRAHCGRHVYQVGGICFFLIVAPPWTSVACVRWCWWSAVFARLDFYSTYLVSASLLRSRGFRELNRIRPVSSSLVF